MTKQLTTQNATITTAAVEVKTLTISGKQVTLAVFRQLREEPLIAEDGTLNGVPWGTVNYHPDKCSSGDHWHVVWQRGAELLRARVQLVPEFEIEYGDTRRYRPQVADRLLAAYVCEWLSGRMATSPLVEVKGYQQSYEAWQGYDLNVGFPVVAKASDSAMSAVAHKSKSDRAAENLKDRSRTSEEGAMGAAWREGLIRSAQEEATKTAAAARDALAALESEVQGWGQSVSDLEAGLRAAAKSEAARRQRWRDSIASVGDLPQLFIAV
ncbi:hypothetical protein ACFVSQ_29845 [Streptomyces niveus]|uniref:hypothetical protein n=1 Tax=Streptomyces niveus TaxID=193462 RepID=UPI0036E81E1D